MTGKSIDGSNGDHIEDIKQQIYLKRKNLEQIFHNTKTTFLSNNERMEVLHGFPSKGGEYKVVQFRDFAKSDNPILYFSPGGGHGDMCKDFIESAGERSHIEKDRFGPGLGAYSSSYFERIHLEDPDSKRNVYYLAGTGFAHIDPIEKEVMFYGGSEMMGRSINKSHVNDLQELYQDWNFETE